MTAPDPFELGARDGQDAAVAESLIRKAAREIGARTRKRDGLGPHVTSADACRQAAEAMQGTTRTEDEQPGAA